MRVSEIFIVQVAGEMYSYTIDYSRLECGTVDWTCNVHSLLEYFGRVDLSFEDPVDAMRLIQHAAVQRAYELRYLVDYKEVLCEKKQV